MPQRWTSVAMAVSMSFMANPATASADPASSHLTGVGGVSFHTGAELWQPLPGKKSPKRSARLW